MEKKYTHLNLAERDVITTMLSEKKSLGEIAKALGRSKSTISRELKRNSSSQYKLYLSHRAHGRAVERKKKAVRRPRLKNDRIASYVRAKLKEGWSPEQIAGRIGIDHPGLSISHEAIYQYIYHPHTDGRLELIGCLRRNHRKRKAMGVGRKERKTKIPGRIPIDMRPPSVEKRLYFGHWEGDSLVSRKSLAALNSLVERKSRLLRLTRLERKTAEDTHNAIIGRLKNLPQKARRTLTLDNGTENTMHREVTSAIGIKCFFAHPYASWERGTNENTNGLVRWYLPKGTDFANITDEQIDRIESLINNRPRKCLGFKTPLEVASSFVALRG
jgi:IS30 family transposase